MIFGGALFTGVSHIQALAGRTWRTPTVFS